MAARLTAAFELSYPQGPALAVALDLALEPAAVTVLFGPSGSGKTSVLRALAGLERPQRGRIAFGDEVWLDADAGRAVPAARRPVGLLFQDYALFPHLTVADNLAYGLDGVSPAERAARLGELVELLGLAGLEGRRPGELSGGQQQRVALGRAMARRPRLLLLDEPLSALDGPTRDQVRRDLARWLRALGIPALLVTHDRTDALALGDQLVLMADGRVRQCGPPAEVFSRPADPALAALLGISTVVRARVLAREHGLVKVAAGTAELWAPDPGGLAAEAYACIPGEAVGLEGRQGSPSSVRNRLPGVVVALHSQGPLVRVDLDCGFPMEVLATAWACEELALRPGSPIHALVKAAAIHLIPLG